MRDLLIRARNEVREFGRIQTGTALDLERFNVDVAALERNLIDGVN